ncbi:MAG: 5'-methylthioadenosine/S-adenosylhomocysteine nucleosidase [Bacteroidia bacterium]|nr:MAG: 5'-methylthioadenosine/S-adenosylhomocysteine nucleosidase [Bacteroidia bacterium]
MPSPPHGTKDLVALTFAMESELSALSKLWQRASALPGLPYPLSLAEIKGRSILTQVTGIGKVHAATSVLRLIEQHKPRCIINVGCCGGIDPSLAVGNLAVSTELAYHDVWCGPPNAPGQVQGMPARFAADEDLVKSLSQKSVHPGLFCCGEYFAPGGDSLQRMRRDFPDGLTIDMESAAMAQVCRQEGVPFASLRIVSDTPGVVGTDHAQQYQDFWRCGYVQPFARVVDLLRHFITRH